MLSMIEAYVGPEKFRQGVSSYLTKYAYGNAAGEDFWNEMTRVTEKPVNRIMKSFVEQPGAPMLTVQDRVRRTAPLKWRSATARFIGTPNAPATPMRAALDAAGMREDGHRAGDAARS